jgi:hypothetical protein
MARTYKSGKPVSVRPRTGVILFDNDPEDSFSVESDYSAGSYSSQHSRHSQYSQYSQYSRHSRIEDQVPGSGRWRGKLLQKALLSLFVIGIVCVYLPEHLVVNEKKHTKEKEFVVKLPSKNKQTTHPKDDVEDIALSKIFDRKEITPSSELVDSVVQARRSTTMQELDPSKQNYREELEENSTKATTDDNVSSTVTTSLEIGGTKSNSAQTKNQIDQRYNKGADANEELNYHNSPLINNVTHNSIEQNIQNDQGGVVLSAVDELTLIEESETSSPNMTALNKWSADQGSTKDQAQLPMALSDVTSFHQQKRNDSVLSNADLLDGVPGTLIPGFNTPKNDAKLNLRIKSLDIEGHDTSIKATSVFQDKENQYLESSPDKDRTFSNTNIQSKAQEEFEDENSPEQDDNVQAQTIPQSHDHLIISDDDQVQSHYEKTMMNPERDEFQEQLPTSDDNNGDEYLQIGLAKSTKTPLSGEGVIAQNEKASIWPHGQPSNEVIQYLQSGITPQTLGPSVHINDLLPLEFDPQLESTFPSSLPTSNGASHIRICRAILNQSQDQSQYLVMEDQAICLDDYRTTNALAQIFLSSYLARQGQSQGIYIDYKHGCSRHRSNHMLIQELLPSPLLYPEHVFEPINREELLSFCQAISPNINSNQESSALDVMLWDTSVPFQKRKFKTIVKGLRWRRRRLQQRRPPPMTMMERVVPIIRENLVKASRHAREVQGALIAGYGVLKQSPDVVGQPVTRGRAVIILPCMDDNCEDHPIVSYFNYLIHIPRSVSVIDLVITKNCDNNKLCRLYANDFASTVRQFSPQSKVELIIANPSAADSFARLIEAEHVICGPGWGLPCLFPALSRSSEDGRNHPP